jgi:hypothetical protein
MARINRVTQKIFAGSASNNGQFGSAQVGTKVESNDLATLMSLAAFDTGWLDAVLGSSKFPPLEEFQALDYILSTQMAYVLQQGIPEWDAGTTYYTNNIVAKAGTNQLYSSKTNANLNNALTDTANWKLLIDFDAPTNTLFTGGTSTGSGNAQVVASTTPSGLTLFNGATIVFTAGFTNTGATTFNIGGTGVITVKKLSGASYVNLSSGDITAGHTVFATYNSTESAWIFQSGPTLGTAAYENLSDVIGDNGSGALTILAGAIIAAMIADGTITGTQIASGIALAGSPTTTNLAGSDNSTKIATTATARAIITALYASKAQMQAATSTATIVNPAMVQNHPGVAKFWADITGASGAINASYNISSVVRNSTGNYTITFTTPFSSANWVPSAKVIDAALNVLGSNQDPVDAWVVSKSATQLVIQCFYYVGESNDAIAHDPDRLLISGLGNQ